MYTHPEASTLTPKGLLMPVTASVAVMPPGRLTERIFATPWSATYSTVGAPPAAKSWGRATWRGWLKRAEVPVPSRAGAVPKFMGTLHRPAKVNTALPSLLSALMQHRARSLK
jgi:hypothetical protein